MKSLPLSLMILLASCGGHDTANRPAKRSMTGKPATTNPKTPGTNQETNHKQGPVEENEPAQTGSNLAIEEAALQICSNPPESAARKKALQVFANYKPGARSVDTNSLASDHQSCVTGLLPSAIYVNLKSGIPVGTLIGQAVQETGWCKSSLAKEALNFHGQKAKFAASNFTYWDGAYMEKSSSESPTASGNNVVSKFMKFGHADYGFYAVAERLNLDGLPYKVCMSQRENAEAFMHCIGKSWAVHATYAEHVLGHRQSFKLGSQNTPLPNCELKKTEWQLDPRFTM